MENVGHSSSNVIGFCLLPSELIHKILFSLALPEIIQLKSLNKSTATMISDHFFLRQYNSQTMSTAWLFVCKKRWHRDVSLDCFTDRSSRWVKIQIIGHLLKPIISSGEGVYLLTASGNIILFASTINKEVIAVNLVTKSVKMIPPSPLGPRGTSSWRRSGMKLVSNLGSDHFRFMFAELVAGHPILFVYNSETNIWESTEAREGTDFDQFGQNDTTHIFLNVINQTYQSMVIAVGSECNKPIILRPRFDETHNNGQLTVRSYGSTVIDRRHMYGDGYMILVKSNGSDGTNIGTKMMNEIGLWKVGRGGRKWEYMSKVPSEIMEKIRKLYWVMMGCLERRDGVIKIVLVSTFQSLWDIIWLSYDLGTKHWSWIPVPDFNMKGLNMAGVAFSSGLTLS